MSFGLKSMHLEDDKSSDTTPLLMFDNSANAAKFGILAMLKSILLFTVHPPTLNRKIDQSGWSPSFRSSDAVFSAKRWFEGKISSRNLTIPGIATAAIP